VKDSVARLGDVEPIEVLLIVFMVVIPLSEPLFNVPIIVPDQSLKAEVLPRTNEFMVAGLASTSKSLKSLTSEDEESPVPPVFVKSVIVRNSANV